MDKIEIGDIVLCVDDSNTRTDIPLYLKKGHEYPVLNKITCVCGCGFICVGNKVPNPTDYGYMVLSLTCDCGKIVLNYHDGGEDRFHRMNRFVKSKRQINKATNKNENLFVKLEPKKVLEPLIFINN